MVRPHKWLKWSFALIIFSLYSIRFKSLSPLPSHHCCPLPNDTLSIEKDSLSTEVILPLTLSPHNELIKKFSKTIDWDWRLLAALIYQESAFQINVTSSKGAIGLMQIVQSTAEKYGVNPNDLFDPHENLKAGTLFLQALTRQFNDTLISNTELIKFVLAAYNAGPEQIKDCRNFAATQGKNPNEWNDVVSVIPLMREQEYAHLITKRFLGDETIRFVEDVLARYALYCTHWE